MIDWIELSENSLIYMENTTKKVVMVDVSAGLGPFIGWFDTSPEGGGFYFRDGMRAVRVICTHYIILPEYPLKDNESK